MTAPLWNWATLVALTAANVDGEPRVTVTGVSIDTRTLAPGDLFVALKAERDGHEFVPAAFKAGAAAALVAKSYQRAAGDGALLRVSDPLRALEDIGRVARFRSEAKVIAVTGSVGKTSTKEAVRACLARAGSTHASEKSYNNHWGVPLTLARMPAVVEFAVFEIGMNHPGEITPLARMVAPDIAVVTTVEPVHLGFFTSVEEIAEAKAEILLGVPTGGLAILNIDNPHFDLLARRAAERALKVVAFGRHDRADVRLVAAVQTPDGSAVEALVNGRRVRYRVGAPGAHYVQNSLAVAAALDAAGADLELCLAALADIAAPVGRGARSRIALPAGGEVLLIDESYNANPASVRAALATLATVPRERWPRRIVVLGDMRELGARASELHRELREPVDTSGADLVFACGEHMAELFETVEPARRRAWMPTSDMLVAPLVNALRPGDVVMIKGSLGTNMAPLVKAVRAIGFASHG